MRRILVLSLAVIWISPASATAQICRGLASFSTGPVQVTGEGSLTPESNAIGAGLGYGLPGGLFGNASIGTRSSDTFRGSSLELGAGAGYDIEVGKFHLCPGGSVGMGMGPNKPFGSGEDRSSRSAQLGVSVGAIVGASPRWQLVPTLALSYAYRKDEARDNAGTTLFQISDHYALAQVGFGLVLHNLTIRPHVELPLSLDTGGPTVGLTVGYNFGRRANQQVP
ncbi:MAG TPA: hypothetical protein VFX42_03265 [Gemmatimonadales bacterium]|nr:hypothetical protein [Gemmatimonadales bacterium]